MPKLVPALWAASPDGGAHERKKQEARVVFVGACSLLAREPLTRPVIATRRTKLSTHEPFGSTSVVLQTKAVNFPPKSPDLSS